MSGPWSEEERKLKMEEDLRQTDTIQDEEQFIEMRPSGPYCCLCEKEATPGHLDSGAHNLKKEEHAVGTRMAGRAESTRKLKGGKLSTGYLGFLTKKGMFKHWGDELPSIPAWAEEVHMEKGAIYIDGNEQKQIRPKDVAGRRLGVVSYRGDGKYAQSSFHWFDDLPDSEEVATEEELAVVPPDGQGWWPVIAMNLNPETEERCSQTCSSWTTATKTKGVLLICFYQLLATGRLVGS